MTTTATPALTRTLVGSPLLQGRGIELPPPELLGLPERAVQFGTGAFLRGFVEFFLDEANRRGLFGGRVVMVGSTGSGRDRALNEQDGLYTLVAQGIDHAARRRTYRVISSVSRALVASTEWDEVMRCAESRDLELIFSNTTEVGIVLDEGDALAGSDRVPHRSFPAKLARMLLHRARHFRYDVARTPVVIPCELIEDNGDRLRDVVRALGARWGLEPEFMRWLDAVPFCNTLVDRIVQGAPTPEQAVEIGATLGYDDAMITVCEPYRLFAIQADERVRARLRFAAADPGIVLADDVSPYRERKVRLLNGSHTAIVSLALLAGFTTVREAVGHPLLGAFLRTTLFDEITPSVRVPGAEEFAKGVLDRFANPYMAHALWDITLQGGTKLRVRLVPVMLSYAQRTGQVPRALALGFAGYLAFQRGELQAARRTSGGRVPADETGDVVRERWTSVGDDAAELTALVRSVSADERLWGADLSAIPGFVDAAGEHLVRIRQEGAHAALAALVGVTA
jgi:tagaturonate reductase